eukprot:scaffold441_cov382-Prasinococcus_capsulatus_cf.AAC.6
MQTVIELKRAAVALNHERGVLLEALKAFCKRQKAVDLKALYDSWGIPISSKGKKETLIKMLWADGVVSAQQSSMLVLHLLDSREGGNTFESSYAMHLP